MSSAPKTWRQTAETGVFKHSPLEQFISRVVAMTAILKKEQDPNFAALCRYRTVWNIDLVLKPFFLGGIMQGTGNKPPAVVPAKAVYMKDDIDRLAKHYQVPLNYLSDPVNTLFVKGSLPSQRFLTAVDMSHPEHTENLSRAFWMRVWNRDQDIIEKESLIAVGKDAGLSDTVIEDALSKMKSDAVKDRLKKFTSEALELGAFGAPTIVAEDSDGKKQMVFGCDRFHILADILGEKYPGPLTELAKSKL